MIRKIQKKLEQLMVSRTKITDEQLKLQEKLNNIDTEIKNYTLLKKEYEKLEKKFNNFLNIKDDTRHE